MPYLDFALAKTIGSEQEELLKAEAARIMQRYAGKSENWLYVRIAGGQSLFFQGKRVEQGGVVQIQLVGSLAGSQKKEIITEIGRVLESQLGIPKDQVYIVFTEAKGENWGWNGQAFG